MACPFFMPTQKIEGGVWLHPSRLPLGAGWQGVCTADRNQTILPTEYELSEFCNLGYALQCPHLPSERSWDAVRISVSRDCQQRILLCYVCEFGHLPQEHGILEYEPSTAQWIRCHPDARIQKMAECYLESYLGKTRTARTAPASS